MATSGINIVQTADRIVFRALLQGLAGAIVTSGTTEVRILRLNDDGSLAVYDWTADQFVACGAGTPDDEQTMTHQQRRDSSGADVDTGVWTRVLTALTAFTKGQVYLVEVTNPNALPTVQMREMQFGGAEGDQYDDISKTRKALLNKKGHDQVGRTRTIYDDDGVTALTTFDLSSNEDGSVITETPQ